MLRDRISATFVGVYVEAVGEEPPALTDESVLLETGLDSLGFAVLVARLDAELGYDPFTLSSEAYYPETFGQFVAFYEEHQPK